MVCNYAPPLRQQRRRSVWRRSPRMSLAAATLVTLSGLVLLAGDVYGGSPASVQQVRVHSGDNLWAIAERAYGTDDVRSKVDAIVAINHLDGGLIQPGQVLTVPAP